MLTVFNLEPKKGRLLAVVHEQRKLVGTLTLTADTKDPVVKLGVGGSVTGRAVDADGKRQCRLVDAVRGNRVSILLFGMLPMTVR